MRLGILYVQVLFSCSCIFASANSYAIECEDKLKYEFNIEDSLDNSKGVKVTAIYQEEVREVEGGKIAANYRQIDKIKDLVKGNVYSPESKNFSIVVPKLTKGEVKIYQKNAPLENGEPDTFTAKFADNSYRIAAIASILLDWIPEETNMLSHFRKQQEHLVKSIDPSQYQFCELKGKYGPGLEVIVFNQYPNFEWPHRVVKRKDDSQSVGIRREFHIGQSVVEFAMVIPSKPDDDREGVVESAREAMDVFMSGYKIRE